MASVETLMLIAVGAIILMGLTQYWKTYMGPQAKRLIERVLGKEEGIPPAKTGFQVVRPSNSNSPEQTQIGTKRNDTNSKSLADKINELKRRLLQDFENQTDEINDMSERILDEFGNQVDDINDVSERILDELGGMSQDTLRKLGRTRDDWGDTKQYTVYVTEDRVAAELGVGAGGSHGNTYVVDPDTGRVHVFRHASVGISGGVGAGVGRAELKGEWTLPAKFDPNSLTTPSLNVGVGVALGVGQVGTIDLNGNQLEGSQAGALTEFGSSLNVTTMSYVGEFESLKSAGFQALTISPN